MQYSDSTNLTGIIQEIDDNCSTNSSSYPLADKTRNINIEYDKVVAFIRQNSGNIKWADTGLTAPYNYTDYDLADGVANITITKPVRFERAEVKNSNGNYENITLIDKKDISSAIQEFETTDGTPKYMIIEGDNLTLYPAPNYTVTDGLRIYTSVDVTLFTVTDTTKEPEIPRLVHNILSAYTSYKYCRKYKKERVTELKQEIQRGYSVLADYLQSLDVDNETIRMKEVDYL